MSQVVAHEHAVDALHHQVGHVTLQDAQVAQTLDDRPAREHVHVVLDHARFERVLHLLNRVPDDVLDLLLLLGELAVVGV